jgi:transposase
MDGGTAQGCAECARLRDVIQHLEARIAELESRLDQNSSNSHKPPGSNLPWQLPRKKPTGGKPGGQKGHQGHHRTLLPPERVGHYVHYVPRHCRHCGQAFAAEAGPDDPPPHRHQVAELPPISAIVTEHQGHSRTCQFCGNRTREPIPPSVLAHVAGPRLAAALSYLTARCHDGRRTVVEIANDLFGVALSLGTIVRYEGQMSDALSDAAAAALTTVQQAQIKNVDETGWKKAGKNCWLWTAATPSVAVFTLTPRRNAKTLRHLIGKRGGRGVICSDRCNVYAKLGIRRRQLCWAHLNREFRKWSEFPAKHPSSQQTQLLGNDGLGICRGVFGLWRDFRQRKLSWRQLQQRLKPWQKRLHETLTWGQRCGYKPVAGFCQRLLEVQKAFWTFARINGVEPTNNHAERMLRPAVLWRKNSFGSQSPSGCRFVERLLTVIQTRRLQGQNVIQFLYQTLHTHRLKQPLPVLV